jgi:phytoene dehydrogenase-like protein
MSGQGTSDAIVIGARLGGLVAATYLARAGLTVTVIEPGGIPGGAIAARPLGPGFVVPGGAPWLAALDPQIVKDLKLTKRVFRFAVRDMPLIGLRPDGRHVTLTRAPHATARALASHSTDDGRAWARKRRAWQELARTMRSHWWQGDPIPPRARETIQRLSHMGAAAFLDSHFESGALKSTLALAAHPSGLSLLEPGSALALLWHSAQQIGGHQGACALPAGGLPTMLAAIVEAAKSVGVKIRTGTQVMEILTHGGAATGVDLANGERLIAPRILSSLSRRHTMRDLVPAAGAGFAAAHRCDGPAPTVATAQLLLALDHLPAFGAAPSARFVIAGSVESLAAAHASARAGQMPDDLSFTFALPTAADRSLAPLGQHVLSAIIHPVPRAPAQGWDALKPLLRARVLAALAVHAPDIARHVTRSAVLTPADFHAHSAPEDASSSAGHLLSGWARRITTPLSGLTLCGADAEPVPANSGRAGRIAAEMILKEMPS